MAAFGDAWNHAGTYAVDRTWRGLFKRLDDSHSGSAGSKRSRIVRQAIGVMGMKYPFESSVVS